MKKSVRISRAVLAALVATTLGFAANTGFAETPLHVEGDHLTLRGKPFQILSGELEYTRIAREDWRDRLRKVRALGLNTVTVYVFWNMHERTPGQFDFSGQNDVAEFVREAQQEGLFVVLRPGPYICGEWDLGGYPAWLLKDKQMLLRSTQPAYLAAARRWMLRLGQELAPLQASRGGPILAVQVENEYGSFQVTEDRAAYLKAVRQIVLDAGFSESLLYTADGGDVMDKGSIPGMLAAVDYGTGDADRSITLVQKFRTGAPTFIAEYWDGWFDHWGEPHQTTDAAVQEREIRAVLSKGYSLSLYMIHGGTSFGWMNGANSDHDGYQPDVSSYDYDAPLDEAGRPRPKYFALRKLIAEVTHHDPPAVPDSPPLYAAAAIQLTQTHSLWRELPAPIHAEHPLSMEDVDQAYGYLLYRTVVPPGAQGQQTLTVDTLHSYARVYVDDMLAGFLDRRLGKMTLAVSVRPGQRLDVLVENSGRINFTTKLRTERAGILGDVHLGNRTLTGWSMYSLPLAQPRLSGAPAPCTGPCFYSGTMVVGKPADTYLNTERLGKGVVWVNGHLLGRFWNIGPMGSLFLPGAWLHAGKNEVTVFDLNGGPTAVLTPQAESTYIKPQPEVTAARILSPTTTPR